MRVKIPDLLITTRKGAFVVLDGKHLELVAEQPKDFFYYGATFDSSYFYLADHDATDKKRQSTIHVFDKDFRKVNYIPTPCVKVHQILKLQNDLYKTDTGHDRIVIFRQGALKGDHFIEIDYLNTSADTRHINSIFVDTLPRLFICEHGRGDSVIRSYHLQEREKLYIPVGKEAHNVAWYKAERGLLMTNSSRAKSVLVFRLDETFYKHTQLNGFTRGLAITNDLIIVGTTVYRDDRKWSAPTDDHVAGINFLYRELNWIEKRYLPAIDNIHEIRALNEIDYAHKPQIGETDWSRIASGKLKAS